MEDSKAIQLFRTNSDLPALPTAEALAAVRTDPRYPHYSSVPKRDRVRWLSLQIMELQKLKHIKPTADSALLDAAALDERMMGDQYAADLTQPEIEQAFKDGLCGDYGDYYGINAPSLYGFIREFIGSEKKRDAAALVMKSREEKRRREAEEERRKILEEMEEAKRNGTFVPTGRAWYRPESVDTAVDSEEHRRKVQEQARQILKNAQQ